MNAPPTTPEVAADVPPAAAPNTLLPVVSGVVLLVGGSLMAWQWLLAPASDAPKKGRGHGGSGASANGAPGEGAARDVRVVSVTRGVLSAVRGVPGEIVSPRRAVIKSRGEGPTLRVSAQLGARVRAGEVLVRLSAPELYAEKGRAEAEVAIRQAVADRAAIVVKQRVREATRRKKLAAEGALSQRALVEAEEAAALARSDQALALAEQKRSLADLAVANARLSRAVVSAPFAGRIARVFIDEGTSVAMGADLVEIVETDGAKVRFYVPPRYASALGLGDKMSVQGPGGTLAAHVVRIGAALDETMRMLPVEAALDEPSLAPVAGGFALVKLDLAFGDEAPLLPRNALVGRGAQRQVFVVDEGGRARAHTVRVLFESDDTVALAEGLPPGARVVLDPDGLSAGQAVDVVAGDPRPVTGTDG